MTLSEKDRLHKLLKGNLVTILNVQDLIAEVEGRVETECVEYGYSQGKQAERVRA